MSVEDIMKAVEILNLPKQASMEEVKKIYRELLSIWHPDLCRKDRDICKKKTQQIVDAYDVILNYCANLKISFSKDDLLNDKRVNNPDRFWDEHFGDDPHWGGPI